MFERADETLYQAQARGRNRIESENARANVTRVPSEPRPLRPRGVPDDAILRVFRVAPEQAGMRVDSFVCSQLRNTSRTRARKIVENSAFSWTGRRLRPSERLRAEQRVVLWRPPFESDRTSAPLPVLYEDDHLLVLDKPAPMTVHPTARYHRYTVIEQLRAARPGEFFSLIHRLDRETSGILLVARSPDADRAFKRLLEARSLEQIERMRPKPGARAAGPIDKTYLAITWGAPENGPIDLPLAPDQGNPLRVKMRVAPRGTGLEARTDVQVVEHTQSYALVRCQLHTGRQHQIRVHLAAVGAPVVGDKLYGPDERLLARAADGELSPEDLRRLELPRHALHAHRYRMTHAMTRAALDLESPLSADLAAFWHAASAEPR